MKYCPWQNRNTNAALRKGGMQDEKWKSKLFPVITLAVCLGLAACGGGAESEGSSDDQEDYEETENSLRSLLKEW